MRAVIYTRVSTAEQAEKKKSLEQQEEQCRDFATKRDLETVKVFREEGESAKTAERTKLLEMLAYCKEHKDRVKYVIVWKVDRFARRAEDHLAMRAVLAKMGIQLLSATEPIENNNTGKLMETILAGFAEFDNGVRSERSANGMKARLLEGGWVHQAPIGYKNIKDPLGRPTLATDEMGGRVRSFLIEFKKGIYTQKQAVGLAKQYQIKSKNGRELSANGTYKMLRNPVYAGLIESTMLEQPVKGLHDPLISRDDHYAIRGILDGRRRTYKPESRAKGDWVLRGFLRCGRCNHPLTGSASTGRHGKRYPKYHCTKCRGGGVSIDKEALHGEFKALLERAKPSPLLLGLFKEIVVRRWNEEHADVQQHRRDIDAEIKKFEDRRQAVLDKNFDGIIADDVMNDQLDRIRVKTIELRQQRSELSEGELEKEAIVDMGIAFIADAKNVWAGSKLEDQQRFQKMVFPGGIAYKFADGFGTPEMGACFEELQLIEAKIKELGTQKASAEAYEYTMVNYRGFDWNQLVAELKELYRILQPVR